ncbi:MAG: phosphoribosylanthranilate isomerase [Candidatus Omnitrophota bacterium]|nr:MAG: phosphoribosylanthranilate isomerase [Candidatus Omnitrophota bacterium]
MTKVKICGITNLKDAVKAVEWGADALGFIFAHSPRRIKIEEARRIIKDIPSSVMKVGVFADAPENEVKQIGEDCALDAVQLHGEEDIYYCKRLRMSTSFKVIKTFHLREERDIPKIGEFKEIEIICLDTRTGEKIGGTGEVFDWSLAERARVFGKKIILAGGLNPGNVKEAIRRVKPWMVDVCTGVEKEIGRKDERLMKEFIRKVKNGTS